MKRNKIRGIAFLAAWILLVASVAWILPGERVEPENPLTTEAEPLKTDFQMSDGAGKADTELPGDGQGQQGDNEQQNESQQEQKEDSEEISEDLPPEPDEGEQAESEQQGDTGENSDKIPGTDQSGTKPTENGDKNNENPGNGEKPGETEAGLITDLYSQVLTFSELKNDTIPFYAYYSEPKVDAQIKVNYRHQSDTGNGKWLKVKGEHDYEAVLKIGKNYITIYYTDANGDRNRTQIVLTYQADKADETKPEVGEHPPIIETNLDGWSGNIKTQEFTFTVSAKTWQGKRIYSDGIQVKMDGKIIAHPTGSGIYEYVLRFPRPNVGDYSDHTISVLAWDAEGNSRYIQYRVRYEFNNKGDAIGSVTVVIDATAVECGIVDEGEVELEAGDTAAEAVVKMLEEYGYEYSASGASGENFYLRSISRADAFAGCHVGERLKGLLERDGIAFTSPASRDKLGEFDFTRGSGWLYFINGSLCPGKAMSAWTLNGGETISLRFTLAYGKDVGGAVEPDGALKSYCAKWVDGQVLEEGHDFQQTSRVEPGADTDGYVEYTCTKCGETKRETLPATGETPVDPDKPGGGENPDKPGGGEEPENPDKPGGGEEPENPDKPGGGGEPENPDKPGGGEEPENPDKPGGGEEPENPGGGEDTGGTEE